MTPGGPPALPPAPNVDLRGFSYALAPYLRKQEWQMERLQARLAGLLQELARAEQALRGQEGVLQAHAGQLRQSLQSRPDPLLHRQGLTFLSGLHGRIALQRREVQTLQAQKADLQSDCLAQQRRIDGLLEHRAQALLDHARQAGHAAAAEADRDWVSRLAMRRRPHGAPGEAAQ